MAEQVAAPGGRAELALAFAAAGRQLGTGPFSIAQRADDPRGDAANGPPDARLSSLSGRGLDEAARVALLLAALGAGDPARAAGAPSGAADLALVSELYLRGDAREKQAVLRALPLLPPSPALVELAVEAVRSSVQTVFEAIACENPFPAEQLSEPAFNQIVLKALFNEVRTSRIVGLERRAGPELLRMVEGYAAERRAAGRTVPADIETIKAFALARSA